jgi:hypothetical protein
MAESIPVPDGFADAVGANPTFHWFRVRTAPREIARGLRSGGGLGLLGTTRDDSYDPRVRVTEVVERYRRGAPGSAGGRWKAAFDRGDDPFLRLRVRRLRHLRQVRGDRFVGGSFRSASSLPSPLSERRTVARTVRERLEADPGIRRRRTVHLPDWTRRTT